MRATIIRADEVKVGDRILLWGQPLAVESISIGETGYEGERIVHMEYRDTDGEPHSVRFGVHGSIARIEPEPVEERQFWRVTFEWRRATSDCRIEWAKHGTTHSDRCHAEERIDRAIEVHGKELRNAQIEHIRETVLSREVIK